MTTFQPKVRDKVCTFSFGRSEIITASSINADIHIIWSRRSNCHSASRPRPRRKALSMLAYGRSEFTAH
jgi:hypothetical protein